MNKQRNGIAFYFLLVIVLSVQLFYYIIGSTIIPYMDMGGWLFYITSCLSHASMIALVPLLLYLLLKACRLKRVAAGVFVGLATFSTILLYIDMLVYNLYRFHINGIVLNMFFGKGGSEIFNFSFMVYLPIVLSCLLVIGGYSLGWYLLKRFGNKISGRILGYMACFLVFTTLCAHGYHIYADFNNQVSVQKSRRLLPYYFPTSANGLLMKNGFVPSVKPQEINISTNSSEINYPVNALQTESVDSLKNIVFILIDSWNPRAFTEECMPNIYEYAGKNLRYDNHWGCSNGTKSSVFGLFFGLSSYYWDVFDTNRVSPLLVDRLLDLNYSFQVYPSAQLYDPPFARVIFNKVDNVRVETEGNTSLERDERITSDFISSLEEHKQSDKPFFSFLFYDLPHSFELPEDKLHKFQPSWKYANYSALNNDMDPLPFWNLYRNTCFQVDSIVGRVLDALEENDMADNTIVIITGDHGQEFNENKKNFWGHNGNFSSAQIAVPLICHFPGHKPEVLTHRTTHYDIVPTLMKNYLGVNNDLHDYSMGYLLDDDENRHWHIVGSELNYAFITEEGNIIEKKADGSMEITDSLLNLKIDYVIDGKKMKESIEKLNHFFK